MTLYNLKKDSSEIAKMGQFIRQNLLDNGKRPRSYVGSVGDFLCRWLDSMESHSIRLVGNDPQRLETVCLDPRIMTGFLDSTAGVVSMSGTISPLEMFRDLVGLRPDTILEKQVSSFPRDNKKMLYLKDVTTSYAELNSKPQVWDKLVERLDSIRRKMLLHLLDITSFCYHVETTKPAFPKLYLDANPPDPGTFPEG
jgi:DNA excision repair protein ERCC-2